MSVNLTLEIINGKWKPFILCYLGDHDMRNGELLRKLPNISQKVLTQQLRELERDGIVRRKNYDSMPPKVEYSLTSRGRSLQNILVELSKWGEERVQELNENGSNIIIGCKSNHIMHDCD